MNTKRIRSVNWDEEEKQLLCSIIKDYAHVIEDKSMNTNTNKNKNKAWEEIRIKFNGLNCRQRQLGQIKLQWKSMKMNARKTCSLFRNKTNKTGGVARSPTPDDSDIEIKDLLNPAVLLRDHNPNDSHGLDKITIEEVDAQVDEQKFTPIVNSEDDSMTANPLETNMANITARKVPKRKFMRKNTRSISKCREDLEYVSAMIMLSRELKVKEHKRRMEMAEELHKERLKCAILEREILELRKIREEKLTYA